MKKLRYSARIGARPEAVWNAMLGPEGYRDWASAFAEGTCYEGSFDEGERILFLTPGGEGMVARIAVSRPPEYVSIEHLGMIRDGVEDTTSEAVRAWAPAYENYSLREVDGATEVHVELDSAPEWEEFMNRAWPKALARLKALCETPAE